MQVESVLKSICINIYTFLYEYHSIAFTHIPIVLISSATPLNYSLEYHSAFHFCLPSCHFSLLFLLDEPCHMHRSGYPVILFFTVSSTAFNPAAAVLASHHPFNLTPSLSILQNCRFPPSRSSSYGFRSCLVMAMPLCIFPRMPILFLKLCLFLSYIHYFPRSHFHPV